MKLLSKNIYPVRKFHTCMLISKNNAPQKRLPNTYESRVSFPPLLNDMLSHKHCVSNCMLRNQIQIITFITFFNDEIDVQEYISGAIVSHMHDNFKNHAPQ
jgi:hypothetical protein